MIEIPNNETLHTKVRFNGTKSSCSFSREDDKLWLEFGFNRPLMEEFKRCFSGMKWGATKQGNQWVGRKQWSIRYDYHNRFQIESFIGNDPYKIYDEAIKLIENNSYNFEWIYPLRQHQKDLAALALLTKRAIFAAEPGLGKSLAAIEVASQLNNDSPTWWIAPKSALYSVKLEYQKWNAKFPVRFMTYDELKKVIVTNPPKMVIIDESQKVKSPTTQRTEAVANLVMLMMEYWHQHATIILMSGTPSPKSPLDWYCQCEIACPGFLKEGNIHLFKERLAIIEKKQSVYGGVYPELIAWKDSTSKCNKCGEDHSKSALADLDHPFEPSVNEVEKLYKRMRGLVIVKTKKACLDLPDKIFDRIYCKKSRELVQAMNMIIKRSSRAIQALTLCRELSDGFQYVEAVNDEKVTCPICNGKKQIKDLIYNGPPKTEEFLKSIGIDVSIFTCSPEDIVIDSATHPQFFIEGEIPCPTCDATGQIEKFIKETKEVTCPKDKILKDLLEEYEDVGRVVIYAGFQAAIDRCVRIAGEAGYQVIRVDGRGWLSTLENCDKNPLTMLKIFQQGQSLIPKLAFIGHPGSAGQGLTLTASPVEIFFSNDFNGESRMQSIDRIHRMGMDVNRGARIVDIINLPTDEYVLDNLDKKMKLQDMTMGVLTQAIESSEGVERFSYGEE